MNLYRSLKSQRSELSLTEYIKLKINGQTMLLGGHSSMPTLGAKQEEIDQTFVGYADRMFKANPIVFGCVDARLLLFSEARFKYRKLVKGRPGELFGNEQLRRLEKPWPNGSTSDLLKQMVIDGDLAGNFFAVPSGDEIRRLRPDWVKIVLGGDGYGDYNAVPIGYLYYPGGIGSGAKPVPFAAQEVVHFAPVPDPLFPWRGMSWLTPVVREVLADQAGTEHKMKYLEEGAVPSMVAKTDAGISPEDFQKFKELFVEEHSGVENKFATYFIGGGADLTVVGSDLKDVDFKAVQAQGENRICVASRVPGIVVGVAEGLDASTMANYGQSRRQFADGAARPWWRDAAQSLSPLVPELAGAELWYDDRDIAYLREDAADEAEVQVKKATAYKLLIDAGVNPDSAAEALEANDFSRLEHTGLVSVQLQKPGENSSENGSANGSSLPAIANQ